MKLKLFFLSMIIIFCTIPVISFSQLTDPFSSPVQSAPPPPPDPVDTPIDGGLSLLLAAGVGYGIKKVRDQRRKQRNIE